MPRGGLLNTIEAALVCALIIILLLTAAGLLGWGMGWRTAALLAQQESARMRALRDELIRSGEAKGALLEQALQKNAALTKQVRTMSER